MKKYLKYIPGISCNNRCRPDGLVRLLRWSGVAGWVVMSLVFIVYGKARPKARLDANGEIDLQYLVHGDITLANVLLALMFAGLIVSMAGIKMKEFRARRRNDEYMYSLYIVAMASLAGIFYCCWFL